jgi:hypothetical protein
MSPDQTVTPCRRRPFGVQRIQSDGAETEAGATSKKVTACRLKDVVCLMMHSGSAD